MKLLRLLLLPFSLIYALVVILRNMAYDKQIFKSTRFDLPVISIGNLAVGGSGKSPMAEYLISLLKDNYKTATLSRGYGRKTTGYVELNIETTAEQGGDEPVQFKQKFPEITVAVCEDRVTGITNLKDSNDVIIMDDAYQHRAVKPGLSLLLFDFNTLFDLQLPLPSGNLREPLRGRKRADILVVTKTPEILEEHDQLRLINYLKPFPQQEVFFSYLQYETLVALKSGEHLSLSEIDRETEVFLLTGIAKPDPLLKKLHQYSEIIVHHNYPDHHRFGTKNILKLAAAYSGSKTPQKIIVTTEKDAQRLRSPEIFELLKDFPVYYLPVTAKMHASGEERFNKIINTYVAKYLHNN